MDFIQSFWQSFASQILGLLPKSPTIDSEALQTFSEIAGVLNYFVPVGAYLTFLAALLSILVAYYAVMAILRFMRLIQ